MNSQPTLHDILVTFAQDMYESIEGWNPPEDHLTDEDMQTMAKAKIAIQAMILEAQIDENQRWADGYAQAVMDNPSMSDPAIMFAAKGDFEARIKELQAEKAKLEGESDAV